MRGMAGKNKGDRIMTNQEKELRAARALWLRFAIIAFVMLVALLAAMAAENAMTNHIANVIAVGK